MKQTIGIIGMGRFGEFMAAQLRPYFDIVFYDVAKLPAVVKKLKIKQVSFEEVASQKIIILSIPVQLFATVTKKLRLLVKKDTLVIDIASVKMEPYKWMKKNLGGMCRILATHPLFGPQSCADGSISGKNFVICSSRKSRDAQIIAKFLRSKLKLNIIWWSAKEHDQNMAIVQGITHLLGRAINELNWPDAELMTTPYKLLKQMAFTVSKDTPSLWLAIMKENPYAKKIRKSLINKLLKLDSYIDKQG